MVDGVGIVSNDALPVCIRKVFVLFAIWILVTEEFGAKFFEGILVTNGKTFLDSCNEYLGIQRIIKMIGLNDWVLEWVS